MTNQESLFRDDRKHLKEFLSYNPFFQEMDKHLHQTGYCKQGYSEDHLCLEQIWLLAIDFLYKSDLVHEMGDTLANPLLSSNSYDMDTCRYLAVAECHLMMVRAYQVADDVREEELAWQCVEQEFRRLDAASDTDLHDGKDFILPGSGDWHRMYAHLIREMYFKRNVQFAFLH